MFEACCRGPQVAIGSSMGALAGAAADPRIGTAQSSRAGERSGPGAGRAGGRLHRAADLEALAGRGEAQD